MKTVHYCWFGGNPLPELAQKCISSWEKYLPGYAIKRWDETNFDFNECRYAKEAYEHKKWAFVSDYARFWILYHYGGLYLDTDVEIIKSLDDIIEAGPYMACEIARDSNGSSKEMIASGLGMYAAPGMKIYETILSTYHQLCFVNPNGTLNYDTVVKLVTDIFSQKGFQGNGEPKTIEGITIYPSEYFAPLNYYTGELRITENTRTIHYYAESWKNPAWIRISAIKRKFAANKRTGCFMEKIELLPFQILNRLENEGYKGLLHGKTSRNE